MNITKQDIADALLDAIVQNDVVEINDDNSEQVIGKLAKHVYDEILLINGFEKTEAGGKN